MVSTQVKVVILGEGGVGKTTLAMRLFSDFQQQYIATIGVQVFPLTLHTSHGLVTVSVWDTAGQERLGGLRDGYVVGSHCAILVCDLSNSTTAVHIQKWHNLLTYVCGEIPAVVVGCKRDAVTDKEAVSYASEYANRQNLPFVAISAMDRSEVFLPFEVLLRRISNTPDLTISQVTALSEAH